MEKTKTLIFYLSLLVLIHQTTARNLVENPTFRPFHYEKRGWYEHNTVPHWMTRPEASFYISTWIEEKYIRFISNVLCFFNNRTMTYVTYFFIPQGVYEISAIFATKYANPYGKNTITVSLCKQSYTIELKDCSRSPKRILIGHFIQDRKKESCDLIFYEKDIKERAEKFETLISHVNVLYIGEFDENADVEV